MNEPSATSCVTLRKAGQKEEPHLCAVPVRMDFSDLEEKVQWAYDNEDEVRLRCCLSKLAMGSLHNTWSIE